MKRIGINYKPLRLALSHRNTVSRLLFLTLFLFSFIGGAMSQNSTFTKDIAGYGDSEGGWYLIAFPIGEDVSPSVVQNMIASNPDDYDLYSFDQNADDELEWRNYKVDDQEFSLVPGRGYLYASKEGVTLTFIGTPYNGDGIIELTKSDGAHFEGWNLIGNPFSVEAIIDHDFYVMNAEGSGIIAAENNTVGPMEGIFVIAGEKGESVTFTPTDDESNARSASLALNLSRGSVSPGSTRGTIDRVIVRFGEGRMLPKFQLNPNHTKVYIPMDGKDYAVVRSKGADEMPVNFKADANGSYTLSLSTEEVSFGYLHLIDSKTGKDIDLLETPSYTFEASTTDDASRFKLVYAQDGNTKPNTLADVKRSPTRGMDNVLILPSHGEEGNQRAWEDDNGGEGGDEGEGDDPQPTTYDLTVESFENLELITFVNNEMQMEGDGTIQVEEGSLVMLSITAKVGYVIETLMVNGENHADDIGDDFTYTFEMPDEGVTISATAEFTPDPNKLYFDTEGSGWEMGDRDNVGFYVFRPDVEPTLPWGAKKLLGTKVYGQDNIWEFDPTKASLNLEQDTQYQIIFVRVSNNNWGDQAYPLVMGTDCLGSIAYCDGTTYEDPVDNSKESLAAFWKEIDASVYGPIIQITSTGNVVGTCYFEGSNGFSILCDFLNDADKIATAREKSGKSDQEIVDNIGTNLGLTKQDVYDAIADTGSDIVWDYNVSTLPGDVVVHFSNDGDIYTIHDAEGWEIFCNFIEGGESFSGKTVELGTNIEVSRCAGSGTDQEHAMDEHPFCGTFDGDGKTLTFNYGSNGTPANEDYIAPFRYVNNATIQHLHVAGDIYTQHTHSAGIVGLAYGTSNITDCRSSVNIHSSINGDGTHGGIMSCSWTSSTTNIEGCLFDGSIQSVGENVTTHSCGGFVGWKNATINVTNSLLAADLSTIGSTDSYTFVRRNATIANSYYTRLLGTEQGKQAHSITAGQSITVALSGTATTYSVSGITAYKDGNTQKPGLLYNGTIYAGNGDAVSLTLQNTATDAPLGYQYDGYTASAGTLSGSTLTMPDQDVTISLGNLTPIDWATVTDGNTEATAYMIYNKEQLDMLATRVNRGNKYSGKYFKLGADIKYAHGDFNYPFYDNYTAIGSDRNNPFCGTFDGQNHVISGIRCMGLFGYIENAKVKNVILADAGISNASDIGGIVGYLEGGTVEGCHVLSDVTITLYNNSNQGAMGFGGIVGYNKKGNISYCTSAASCTYSNVNKKADFCGGITSYNNDGNISYCLYLGNTLNATAYAGAITGSGDRGIISNCYYTSTTIQGKDKDGNTIDNNVCFAGHYYDGRIFGSEDALVPNDNNSGNAVFLDLMARRNQALTAVERTTPLSTAVDITLSGRTLYKDGAWNTLCLPFDVTAAQMAETTHPLYGATIKELDATGTYSGKQTGFDATDGTLYLYFKDATTIEAGKPYIVKWATTGSNIENPVFNGVIIDNSTASGVTLTDYGKYIVSAENSGLNTVQFIGSYSPLALNVGDKSNLFLSTSTKSGNTVSTLYYPSAANNKNGYYYVNAFRGYFHVELGNATGVRAFQLNFGEDEKTGIVELKNSRIEELKSDTGWYALDGRKLSGKPAKKGMYVYCGKKVVIK